MAVSRFQCANYTEDGHGSAAVPAPLYDIKGRFANPPLPPPRLLMENVLLCDLEKSGLQVGSRWGQWKSPTIFRNMFNLADSSYPE